MKTLFNVRNSTGETWPAYAMGRLGAVILRDGVNEDHPLYALIKPDGADGVYIVNGASPLADGDEGAGIHYLDAQRVAVPEALTVALDDVIGAVEDQWEAGDDEGNGGQFRVVDEKNDLDVAPVVAISTGGTGSGSGSSGSSGCPCTCISTGDIVVDGVITSSRWTVTYGSAQVFTQTNGKVTLPAGAYVVVYDEGSSTWVLDVGDELTAAYHSGVDATADSTLDGTITMTRVSGSPPEVELCVTADIPEEPEGS